MNAIFSPGAALLDLVRTGVIAHRRADCPTLPPPLPPPYDQARGCVISLLDGQGRVVGVSCQVERPVDNLAQAVLHGAAQAEAQAGGRAKSARVDVIHRIVPVVAQSALDARRYGVIVSDGRRFGAQPPHLGAIATVAEQVLSAKAAAGIAVNAPIRLYRFTGEWFADALRRSPPMRGSAHGLSSVG